MGVLGIRNRTENWKTAQCFLPLRGKRSVSLAKRLGEHQSTQPSDLRLELFWKGIRDYLHHNGGKQSDTEQKFVDLYLCLFGDLRSRIETYGKFQPLKDLNYDVSTHTPILPTGTRATKLSNNLINTELDIVLETPNQLYIGEAKDESGFHADGKLVLVHQLIRQYVVANILLKFVGCKKKVVPFVVGNDPEALKKRRQVDFMIQQDWMTEGNVLSWAEVEKLSGAS